MMEVLADRYIYLFVLALLAIGLYGVLAKTDLVKKVIGLVIFTTAIYLFFIHGSLQEDATAPVIDERGTNPALYVDPLPHLLILTAIVVGVGILGVALALLVRLYRTHGTMDEGLIVQRLSGVEPGVEDTAATVTDAGAREPADDGQDRDEEHGHDEERGHDGGGA
jgi:multicomponent Na+:H+ antiporter subunit C